MKNRVNKQIIKALSVGLAASMALQPVTAFAEGTEGDTTEGSVPSSAVDTNAPIPQDIPNGPADEAQNAAKVVSNDVPAPAEESSAKNERGDLNITADDVAVVTDDILVNHAENGADATNAIVGEAGTVEKAVKDENGNTKYDENGKEVKVEVDAAQDVITDASLLKNDTNLSGATTDIENTKKDLIIAENADRDENNLATAASSVVKDIQTETAEVEKEVNKAVEQANTLANNIKNASSIPAAQKAYDDLDQLVKDTQDAVKTYNKDLYGEDGKGGLMAKYAAAQKLLDNAQSRYDDAIGEKATEETPGTGAKGSVEAAKKKVAAAQKTVDDLAGAIAAAQSNIRTLNAGALEISTLLDEIENPTEDTDVSESQKQLFNKVMETYYVKEMIDENATDVAVNKSSNGYFTVTYKDASGAPVTKFFGLDTTEGQFLMYEKSADEVAAIDYLAAYEANHSVPSDKKAVYKYVDSQGNTQYKVLAEIENNLAEVKNGDKTLYYLKSGNGVTTPVELVSAPTSLSDIANVNDKLYAKTIVGNARKEAYTIEDGKLVKHTYANVSTTTYQKLETSVLAAYKKDGYNDNSSKVRNEINTFDRNHSDIVIRQVVSKDSQETYYVVEGTYIPTFTYKLPENGVKTRVFNAQEAIDDVIYAVNNSLTYTGWDWEEHHLGTVIDSDLTADTKGGWNGRDVLSEEYTVKGTVVVKKEGTQTFVLTSSEFTSEEAAQSQIDAWCANAIKNDWLHMAPVSIETQSDPYVGTRFNGPYNLSCEETYKFDKTYTDSYKKKSFAIQYIQKIGKAAIKEEEISSTEYANFVAAIEVLQDELKNNGFDVNDENQNQELMKLVEDAQNLLAKYQGYAEKIATVQGDIATTDADIKILSDAIDELDQNHRDKTAGQVLAATLGNNSIAKYFNVTDEDIIGFFKVQDAEAFKESDPEGYEKFIQDRKDDLGKMKIDNFENFLDYLKKKAESKKKDIEGQLKNLEDQRDQSEKDLQDTIDRLTPPSGDDEEYPPRDPDADSTVVNPVVRPVVTQVVANDGQAVLGEVRKTSTRKSTAKAAADTETTAVDNSNSDNAEVAGAQKEETKTPEAPKEETKIEDNETALAATPELEEKGFAWWWLLILAAIAGVSVEEYARRKSNKAKAEAKDSTKINK